MQLNALQYIKKGGVFDLRNKEKDKYTLTMWSLLKRGYVFNLFGQDGLTVWGEKALAEALGEPLNAIDSQASDQNPTQYDYGFVDGFRYANTGELPPKKLLYCDLTPGQWFRCTRLDNDSEPMMVTNEKTGFHQRIAVSLSGKIRHYHNLTHVELVKPRLSFDREVKQ
jgi:hypothetical protein